MWIYNSQQWNPWSPSYHKKEGPKIYMDITILVPHRHIKNEELHTITGEFWKVVRPILSGPGGLEEGPLTRSRVFKTDISLAPGGPRRDKFLDVSFLCPFHPRTTPSDPYPPPQPLSKCLLSLGWCPDTEINRPWSSVIPLHPNHQRNLLRIP